MIEIKNMNPGSANQGKILDSNSWSFTASEIGQGDTFEVFELFNKEEEALFSLALTQEDLKISKIEGKVRGEDTILDLSEDHIVEDKNEKGETYFKRYENIGNNSFSYMNFTLTLTKEEEFSVEEDGYYNFSFKSLSNLSIPYIVLGFNDSNRGYLYSLNEELSSILDYIDKDEDELIDSIQNYDMPKIISYLNFPIEVIFTEIIEVNNTKKEKEMSFNLNHDFLYFLEKNKKYKVKIKTKEQKVKIDIGETVHPVIEFNDDGKELSSSLYTFLTGNQNFPEWKEPLLSSAITSFDSKVSDNENKEKLSIFEFIKFRLLYSSSAKDYQFKWSSLYSVYDFVFLFSIPESKFELYSRKIQDKTLFDFDQKTEYSPKLFQQQGNYLIQIKDKNNELLKESSIESYKIIHRPTIKIFITEALDEKVIGFMFTYEKTNQYPKLWHKIQIYNIDKNQKKISIYDSKEVYSAVTDFVFDYNLLLPNEEYKVVISAADINNIESEKFEFTYNTGSNEELEIDFKKKEIVSKTSESFLKINCKDFGFEEKLLPSTNLFPGKDLFPLSFEEKDFIETKILRQNLINNHAIWVATIPGEEANNKKEIAVYDYGVKANIPYVYWAYGDFNSISKDGDEVTLYTKGLQGIKLNDEPIIAEWDRWTLITADKDPENEKIYHVDKVFTFEMNLSSGSMTNGTKVTTSKNFTEFPVIQKDKSNFYSGSLTALMGVRKWGSTAEDFEQTPHMLEELRQLSTNYQPKFLKDRSGHLWRVEINGAIQVANTDNLATIDLKTMTVPWVQIGEADDISLIYTGTEKKEDLYC